MIFADYCRSGGDAEERKGAGRSQEEAGHDPTAAVQVPPVRAARGRPGAVRGRPGNARDHAFYQSVFHFQSKKEIITLPVILKFPNTEIYAFKYLLSYLCF